MWPAAVEHDRAGAVGADHGAQVGQQPGELGGQGCRGGAVITMTGSPSVSVTQVSSVAGPAIRIRAIW